MLSAAFHWLVYRDDYLRLRLDLETWSAKTVARGAIQITRAAGGGLPVQSDGWKRLPLEFQVPVPGRRFYLARCDGEVAHISWVFFIGDRSRFLALGPHQVEITDSHTVAAYRGRGIYKDVLARILADLKDEGVRTAYAHVVVGNTSSLRAMRAVGFQPVEVVVARRLLGVYWTSVRPAAGVSPSVSAPPTIDRGAR